MAAPMVLLVCAQVDAVPIATQRFNDANDSSTRSIRCHTSWQKASTGSVISYSMSVAARIGR